jgi:hypothetical protein
MERKRYILFRAIFLLALLLSSGATAYSSGMLNTYSIELTTDEVAVEPGLCTDNQLVFDDQSDRFYSFRIADLPEFLHGVPDDCSVIHNFCISVWHPPKIS